MISWSASGLATNFQVRPGEAPRARSVWMSHRPGSARSSGGERQRLAWRSPWPDAWKVRRVPGLVCLDEPTRGMDRGLKGHLNELAARLSGQGAAVVIRPMTSSSRFPSADRVVPAR